MRIIVALLAALLQVSRAATSEGIIIQTFTDSVEEFRMGCLMTEFDPASPITSIEYVMRQNLANLELAFQQYSVAVRLTGGDMTVLQGIKADVEKELREGCEFQRNEWRMGHLVLSFGSKWRNHLAGGPVGTRTLPREAVDTHRSFTLRTLQRDAEVYLRELGRLGATSGQEDTLVRMSRDFEDQINQWFEAFILDP
jgi:hypothetical protein